MSLSTTVLSTIDDLAVAPGRIGICPLPGRGGNFDGDLAAIAAWRPAIVVSMTGLEEMTRFGAAGLGQALARQGIAHAHFPVADFGTPEATQAPWPELAARLHAALDSGGKVLLHCMAGKGRSGMIALRLMTERGHAPEVALAAIRAARPGAVETAEQERWGKAGAAAPTAPLRTMPRP